MTQYLPPNLLALFAPRDPIPFAPQIDKHANHRKLPYTGVAQFLGEFEDPSETPPPVRIETRDERKERKRREKQEQANYKLEQDIALWNPKKNSKATGNPYNTMFIARLAVMVKNIHTGKSRGYAFIEFEHERDMHAAVKAIDGKKVDGVRVIADVERGRTRTDWRPRRLGKSRYTEGKGLGKSRQGPSEKSRSSRHDSSRDNLAQILKAVSSRDHDRRRSRSHSKDRSRRRSHSRDRYKKHRTSERDRDRDHKRRRREEMQQYGEYGAEIRAEYNGDM